MALIRSFPTEEKYSLTDQIRRSSRAVKAMAAEAWARRQYRAVFINKIDETITTGAKAAVTLINEWRNCRAGANRERCKGEKMSICESKLLSFCVVFVVLICLVGCKTTPPLIAYDQNLKTNIKNKWDALLDKSTFPTPQNSGKLS